MASITLAVDDKLKSEMANLLWVNWSELAKEKLIKEQKLREQLEEFRRIVSKSKFTEKDSDELSDKVKSSMHERLKKRGLL